MESKSNLSEEEIRQAHLIIGGNVKRIREAQGLSQLELAIAIGHKSVSTISSAEIGFNKKHFNIEHLLKISRALEVDVSEFFQGLSR